MHPTASRPSTRIVELDQVASATAQGIYLIGYRPHIREWSQAFHLLLPPICDLGRLGMGHVICTNPPKTDLQEWFLSFYTFGSVCSHKTYCETDAYGHA